MKPVTTNSLPGQQLVAKATGQPLSFARSLSDAFGLIHLLVHHEVLLPGRSLASSHRHSLKEELFFVLAGTPTVIVDGVSSDLKPGDTIGFPVGGPFRTIVNQSDQDAIILTIGTNQAEDIVEYKQGQV